MTPERMRELIADAARRATFPRRRAARPMRDFRAASRLLAGLDSQQEVDA